jgi:hypothetical protein
MDSVVVLVPPEPRHDRVQTGARLIHRSGFHALLFCMRVMNRPSEQGNQGRIPDHLPQQQREKRDAKVGAEKKDQRACGNDRGKLPSKRPLLGISEMFEVGSEYPLLRYAL